MGNIFAFIQDPDGKLWKLNFKSIQADSSTSSKLNLTYVIMTHTQDSSTKWSNTLPIRGMPMRSACAAWKPLTCKSGLDYYTRNHTSTCTQCTSMGYLVNQDVNSTAFARATKEFIQTRRQDQLSLCASPEGLHSCVLYPTQLHAGTPPTGSPVLLSVSNVSWKPSPMWAYELWSWDVWQNLSGLWKKGRISEKGSSAPWW